ncbi:NUDIX hydrolase [Neobacillus piezotolerans]|uniref:NUDIX hydrolase n=1 Tax=Neobacillus piezotolerans TaxID=2259171 RepID=A0A3D8GUU9_9BACI|nr:NUDIX domain-containing protein [Neobacillus piezotolerans]RDU37816.1 NUDIX hydrolase [Neobacillus piezotolerans]
MHVRNSAKAVIIMDEKILLIKKHDEEGNYYLFPGGGQDHGETLHEALVRECIEEIGQPAEIGELLYIREYIGKNHEFSSKHSDIHQVEYYFACKLVDGVYLNQLPANPDENQIDVVWLPIDDIFHYNVYPKELRHHIIKLARNEKSPVYLGDIN